MLNAVWVAFVVSIILGYLAGLGVGGGSLFILWLTLVLEIDANIARAMNLMFFLPTALVSSIFRWKQGALNLRTVVPGMIAGCISAAIFSLLSRYLPTAVLQSLFGVLLLVTGIKELMYKPKN